MRVKPIQVFGLAMVMLACIYMLYAMTTTVLDVLHGTGSAGGWFSVYEPKLDLQPTAHAILITGSHRSGSTWIGSVIEKSSPDICYCDEPFHAGHEYPAPPFSRWYQYVPSLNFSSSQVPRWIPTAADERNRPSADAFPVQKRGGDAVEWVTPLAVTDYLDRSLQCQLRADIRSSNSFKRLYRLHLKRRKPQSHIPLMKDPLALLSTEWLVHDFRLNPSSKVGRVAPSPRGWSPHERIRPLIIVRHPASFIDSLIRPNWSFDFNDFALQTVAMETILKPWAEEIRNATRGIFTTKYASPYPAPDASPFPGWQYFPGYEYPPDAKDDLVRTLTATTLPGMITEMDTIGLPIGGLPTGKGEVEPAWHVFTSHDRRARRRVRARGEWVFHGDKTRGLYVRRGKVNDLMQIGILVWRILYGVVAAYRRAHPDWMIVRYEDLLCPDIRSRTDSWGAVFQYLGLNMPSSTINQIRNSNFDRGAFHFVNTLQPDELHHIRDRVSDVFYEFYDDNDWPASAIPPGATPRIIPFSERTIAHVPPSHTPAPPIPNADGGGAASTLPSVTTVPCNLRAHEKFSARKPPLKQLKPNPPPPVALKRPKTAPRSRSLAERRRRR